MNNYFSRQEMILGEATSKKIKETSILVIGVGAGGNEVLKNLILMGFGNLTIVDFDEIEDSNLSRTTLFIKDDIGKSKSLIAAERLSAMALHNSPKIKGIHGNIITDVGKGLFANHDIIICCVDTLKARAYINDLCVRLEKPFFEMGFENFNVDISFFVPNQPNSPCLRELIGQGDFAGKRNSCSGLKAKDENLAHIPTIQVASAMAGVLIATEIVKYLNNGSSLINKTLKYYGYNHSINTHGIARSKNCRIHDYPPIDLRKEGCSNEISIRDFLNLINEKHNNYFILKLSDKFIFSSNCENCNKKIVHNKWKNQLFNDERWCKECLDKEQVFNNFNSNWKGIEQIHLNIENQEYLGLKLSEVGVPSNDILTLIGAKPKEFIHILID